MKQEIVNPDWIWAQKFGITPGIKIGNTIYLSGCVAVDGQGNLVGPDDLYSQSVQIFRNIDEALISIGSGLQDVVKITTFLTDMTRYSEFTRARAEAFPRGAPASSTVATPTLVAPQFLLEVEAVAVQGSALAVD